MGYRIDYTQPKKSRLGAMTAGWFLVFLLLVGCFWPRGRMLLAEALFPGNRAVTTAALGDFVRDMGDGEPLGQALEAFCRQILETGP